MPRRMTVQVLHVHHAERRALHNPTSKHFSWLTSPLSLQLKVPLARADDLLRTLCTIKHGVSAPARALLRIRKYNTIICGNL